MGIHIADTTLHITQLRSGIPAGEKFRNIAEIKLRRFQVAIINTITFDLQTEPDTLRKFIFGIETCLRFDEFERIHFNRSIACESNIWITNAVPNEIFIECKAHAIRLKY